MATTPPPPAFLDRLNRAIRDHQAGHLDAAQLAYQTLLTSHPNHPDLLHLLGTLYAQKGLPAQAIDLITRAVHLNPAAGYQANLALAYLDLGDAHIARHDPAAALPAYQTALSLTPNSPHILNNLGVAHRATGNFPAAQSAFERALALDPRSAEAWNNLGVVLFAQHQFAPAKAAYEKALTLNPNYAEAWNNLGAVATRQGNQDEAIAAFHKCLALAPTHAGACNNLAHALKETGDIPAAIDTYRRALAIDPAYVTAHSNLLYTLHFDPRSTPHSLLKEHQAWNTQHTAHLTAAAPPHKNDRTPTRRLRIGYISPDLRKHAIARFLLPILESHDPAAVEIFCYSDVLTADATTDKLRAHTHTWRDIKALPDAAVADLIRTDQIDILIDLTMHMERNRLLVLARKPAPVQLTYLAYCSTTGLTAIDYRLSDPHLDPPGTDDDYTEKTVRLPNSWWCYSPENGAPPVNPLPALTRGYITFGCLNNFGKVSPATLHTWSTILQNTPNSRLILHAHPGRHRDRVLAHFAAAGISPARITFIGLTPFDEYMQTYLNIDISLDTFPWAGGTTSCDSLWMGVPPVTLAGPTAVGRGGASLLTTLALTDLITHTPEAYAARAITLAQNLPHLAQTRAQLRDRMLNSALMDKHKFTREFETALRNMWTDWCRA